MFILHIERRTMIKFKISFEGVQDTLACQTSCHSSHVFSRKCSETSNLNSFTKSKCHQNEENQQTATKIESVLKVRNGIKPIHWRPMLIKASQITGNSVLCSTLLFKSNGIYFSNAYLINRSSIFWSKLLSWHLSGVLWWRCEISHAYGYSSRLYDHS